jgi:hypothetical protein
VKGKPVTSWAGLLSAEWDPAKDFSFGMLNAERLTKLLCFSHTAEVLVRQAHACAEGAHGAERREIALRYVERFEPRARGVLIEIEASSGSLLQRLLGRSKRAAAAATKHQKAAE